MRPSSVCGSLCLEAPSPFLSAFSGWRGRLDQTSQSGAHWVRVSCSVMAFCAFSSQGVFRLDCLLRRQQLTNFSYQYIIDSYEIYAASALASATMIRYVASGGMVIVATPFYKNMGVPYTLTIMACLSALMAPVPFVFYRHGPWIRSKSRHAIKP